MHGSADIWSMLVKQNCLSQQGSTRIIDALSWLICLRNWREGLVGKHTSVAPMTELGICPLWNHDPKLLPSCSGTAGWALLVVFGHKDVPQCGIPTVRRYSILPSHTVSTHGPVELTAEVVRQNVHYFWKVLCREGDLMTIIPVPQLDSICSRRKGTCSSLFAYVVYCGHSVQHDLNMLGKDERQESSAGFLYCSQFKGINV